MCWPMDQGPLWEGCQPIHQAEPHMCNTLFWWVWIINTNTNIKDSTHGYQNHNNNQILIIGGYVKVSESLYTQAIMWVNIILNHTNTMATLPGYEGSCKVYRIDKPISNTRQSHYIESPLKSWNSSRVAVKFHTCRLHISAWWKKSVKRARIWVFWEGH